MSIERTFARGRPGSVLRGFAFALMHLMFFFFVTFALNRWSLLDVCFIYEISFFFFLLLFFFLGGFLSIRSISVPCVPHESLSTLPHLFFFLRLCCCLWGLHRIIRGKGFLVLICFPLSPHFFFDYYSQACVSFFFFFSPVVVVSCRWFVVHTYDTIVELTLCTFFFSANQWKEVSFRYGVDKSSRDKQSKKRRKKRMIMC